MLRRTKKVIITLLEIFIILAIVLISVSYIYFRYYKETTFRYAKPLPNYVTEMVNSAVDSIDIANGIQVVKVDLDKNVRYVVYSYFTDPDLAKLYSKFSDSRITAEIPVFSKNDVENARVIRLMNHKVDCVPFEQTLSYKLAPDSAEFIEVVCTISIPPAYNEFKGIIAMSLNKTPSETDKEKIREVLTKLSDTIYTEVK